MQRDYEADLISKGKGVMESLHHAKAFEAAKASIENWIATRSNELNDERGKAVPNVSRLRALNTEVSRLVRGRLSLSVNDYVDIAHCESSERARPQGKFASPLSDVTQDRSPSTQSLRGA